MKGWMLSLVITSVLLICGGCDRVADVVGWCANRESFRLASPDGSRDAVVFERDCGAGSGFSTQVSVLPHGNKSWGIGNALELIYDYGKVPMDDHGVVKIVLKWTQPKLLTIAFPKQTRVVLQAKEVNGVTITYSPVVAEQH